MSTESYETTEEYLEVYEMLQKLLNKREEMLGLLKIAQPKYIPRIREAIAGLDDCMGKIENLMELQRDTFLEERKAEKQAERLVEKMEEMIPQLRAQLAEHSPEKLEMFDAMLSDDETTH